MFGILKSGIKLGIGCFVTILLLIGLAAGAFFYYCGRKPAAKPHNANRPRAALVPRGLNRFANSNENISSAAQAKAEDLFELPVLLSKLAG